MLEIEFNEEKLLSQLILFAFYRMTIKWDRISETQKDFCANFMQLAFDTGMVYKWDVSEDYYPWLKENMNIDWL